jgi:hypothetical protein
MDRRRHERPHWERLFAARVLFVLVLVASSCDSESAPFDGDVSHSQFWEYHDRVGEPLCPTLLSLLDQHAQEIGGTIGLTLDSRESPFRYYKFRDSTDFNDAQVCTKYSGACATGNDVYSPRFFHAHEQAHDYVYRAWGGWSAQLLDEGVAVALSCDPIWFINQRQKPADLLGGLDWRNLLALNVEDRAGYIAAGYFVTSLVQRYGWPNFAELHRRVPRGVNAADFMRLFNDIYPQAMDQSWAEALSSGAQPCLKERLCDAVPMAVGEDASVACDGQMHRSVTVTDQGGVEISIHGGNGEITLVQGCGEAAPPWLELTSAGVPTTHWVSLRPGTYTLLNLISPGMPDGVAFKGYLPSNFLAAECEDAGAIPLDPEGDTHINLLLGPLNGWIGLAGGGGNRYMAYAFGITTNAATDSVFEICDGCGATSNCVIRHSSDSPISIGLGEHAVVHLRNAVADHFSTGPQDPGAYLQLYPVNLHESMVKHSPRASDSILADVVDADRH